MLLLVSLKISEALFNDASGFLISCTKSVEKFSAVFTLFCNSFVISLNECDNIPNSSFLLTKFVKSTLFLLLSLMLWVKLTRFLIGFKKYLFKTKEKIKITIPTNIAVRIIKVFLSLIAVLISFAFSEINK